MKVRFWGVRGSTPTPERENARYGGNTSCIEVRLADGTLLILDCGTGLRQLGKSLLREFGEHPLHAYLFLTHFHWDHIQGIPFFLPLYKEGNVFVFHSFADKGRELQSALEGQMLYPYFPVDMGVMSSVRHFRELSDQPLEVGSAKVTSHPLNHPQGCVGYRIEADGAVLVLATDTEPGVAEYDRSIRELARGADLFIYDAQYTPEELRGEKEGWGHSCWLEGTRIAQDSGVKSLVLFHYDPDHDDAFVDGLLERARKEFPQTIAAAEGMQIELPAGLVIGPGMWAAERRGERRYQVELPLLVMARDEAGKQKQVRGQTRNISKSGIYFVAPEQIPTDRDLVLEMLLPDDATQRGALELCFHAQPVREESAASLGPSNQSPQGVGARITRLPAKPKAPPKPKRKKGAS